LGGAVVLNKYFPAFASLVVLAEGIFALSASGQVIHLREPASPLTVRDVSTKSPMLSFYPAIEAKKGPLQFEDRSGSLVLSQMFGDNATVTPGTILDNSNTKVLWSETLGTEPLKFTFVAGEGEERLLDNTGKTIWSQATSEQARAGIAATRYNAGLVVPFTITKESGSMDIADKNHRLLETASSESLRLTVLTADEKFPKYAPSPFSARNTFEFLPDVARTQANPLSPGRLYVTYHATDGNWAAAQLVRANRVRVLPAPGRQDMLEVNTKNLNEAGTPENNPSIEYGWSQALQNANDHVPTL